MTFHHLDPDEPENCPNRNAILRDFQSKRNTIFHCLKCCWATPIQIALYLHPFGPREIDEVLRDAGVPVCMRDGERIFSLDGDRSGRPPYQLVKDFNPSAITRRLGRLIEE